MWKKVKIICIFITIIVLLVIKLLNINNLYVFWRRINQNTILCCVYMILILLLFSFLKGKLVVIRVMLTLSIIFLFIFMIWNYNKSQKAVFIFNSPGKANTLLIEDAKFTHFYVKKTPLIYKSLKVDLAATSIHSFENNLYSVRWSSDDIVEVKYLLFDSSYFCVVFNLNNTNKLYEGTITSN